MVIRRPLEAPRLTRLLGLGLVVCSLWTFACRAADPLPYPPFTALYRLYINELPIGHQELTLLPNEDGSYRYTAKTDSIGIAAFLRDDSLNELSTFRYRNQRIQPQDYEFHHVREGHERHVRIHFDWDTNTVTNDIQGDRWQMDIPDNALDKLVVQLAMILDLQQGRRDMEYAIADGGKLKTYRFKVREAETVRTPAGKFEALKLERLRADQDRTTYIWAAPELDYLPVQIKQIEHEDNVVYLSRLVARDVLPDQGSGGGNQKAD